MTDAEKLRKAAQWIRENGFSPLYYSSEGHGCFLYAIHRVEKYKSLKEPIRGIIGCGFSYSMLQQAGWTGPECTDDAAAALEIAADLLTPAP